MKKNGEIYYNFPAELMRGFWKSETEKLRCLNEILNYCAYDIWCKKGRREIVNADFNQFIREELNVEPFYDNISKASFYRMTQELREKYDHNFFSGLLFFSISQTIFIEFHNKEKTAEERIELLAYLAVKSILGIRGFAKTNRFFLTSRMACNLKCENSLPDEILKYRKRYHFDKLKTILYCKFKVSIYTDKTIRGFYVSLRKDEKGKPDILWLAQQVSELKKERKENSDPLKIALLEARRKIQHHDST